MTWLALRLLRPYLIVAAALSAISAAFILVASRTIQSRADAYGIIIADYAPDRTGLCEPTVTCLPAGTATSLAQATALVAAFVPLLVGLILGVPLFAREREDQSEAFVLTQSVPRSRWLFTKLFWALAIGATATAVLAVAFRLTAARYTLILENAGYSWLQEIHHNNVGLMVMQTVFMTALAAVVGLITGRTLRALVVAVAAWPVALIMAQIGGLLLGLAAMLLTLWSDSLSTIFGTLDQDETATFSALVLAVGTAVVVRLGKSRLRRVS
ncbi:hypothetical protein JIG36_33260 [Actinoplanes sp. LDG1-06]|uniref:ABC transporter permease n=1 Tax=Paractinoplanes ovalisporus TaxID=2810368 RepID=A0ABS2AKP2_9ACTN|nr:hypothetical protein [Actinoplanes ovalisporus]MBM2620392.1 hypothetical protein [Actinoplanes ovalisporus]